ncbi:MAG: polysaccharide biosynthesis tyrosine autokinase, partial [Syntrophales bacterium]
WRVIKRRKFIILLTVALTGLFSLVAALIEKPVPVYQASTSIKMERNTGGGIFMDNHYTMVDDLQTQVATIKSYYMMEMLAKEMGLIPASLSSEEVRKRKECLDIILDLKSKVSTQLDENKSTVIDIIVKSEDPKSAARAANSLAAVYGKERYKEINKRTIEAKRAVEAQLKLATERLRNSEEAVRDFKEKNKLVSVDSQSASLLTQMNTLQMNYDKNAVSHQNIAGILKLLEGAENRPLTSKTSFYYDGAPALYHNLNDRLVKLMLERDTLLITFTEEYPAVVELKAQIRETVKAMQAQLLAMDKGLVSEMKTLQAKMDVVGEGIKRMPEKGIELARLDREVQVAQEVYTLLNKKHQEAMIREAENIEEVKIVKPALEPSKPINPPKVKENFLLGLIIGLAMGVVFAFLIETFDTSIGAIEEVEEFLRVPVLGLVPHVTPQEIKAVIQEKYGGDIDPETLQRDARLISHFAPKSNLAESYRTVRTNVNFASLEKGIQSIVLTSSSPQEGKTSTIVNLAITMAQSGRKVLLVEGDLRKPVIAKMFGLPSSEGLTDAIHANFEWKKCVRTIADMMAGKMTVDEILKTPGIDNLNVLPAGTIPPNPAELISSQYVNDMISEAKKEYDYVFIDAPPLLSAADAAVLSSKADGVVMVYRVGKIPRGALKRAKSQLEHVKANIIGVVLNGLRAELSTDYSDYRYRSYYYYGAQKAEQQSVLEKIGSLPGRAIEMFRTVAKNPFRKKEATADPQETPEAFIKELLNKTSADVKAASQSKVMKKIIQIKNLLFTVAIMTFTAGILQQSEYLRCDFPGLLNAFRNDLKQSAQAGGFEIAMGVKAREASRETVPQDAGAITNAVSSVQTDETTAVPATSGGFIRQKIDRER